MLKIRLQRVGRKHEPAFRVVLTDSKNSTKSGRFHEVLGSYDPRKTTESINGDRIKEWMSKGAQISDTVRNLLISKKIIDGKKVNVLPKKSPVIDEEKIAAEKAAAEAAEAARIAKEQADQSAEAGATGETEVPAETPTETPAESTPESTPSTTDSGPSAHEESTTPEAAETPQEEPKS